MKEVELIVSGEVQGVGYRQYVAGIGRKLKLAGFVKNLKDGTVQIRCKGDEKVISEFKKKIDAKNPPEAPLIYVEAKDIKEKRLPDGTVKEKNFKEIYDEPSAEMSQGFSTGIKYMALFNKETQANLNLFRTETKSSFEHMDEKYDKISQAMYAVVEELEERNKTFENKIEKIVLSNNETNKVFESRMEKIESRMEKTGQNIESLLKILAEKKAT